MGTGDGSTGGGGHRELLFFGVMGKQVAKDPDVPSWSNPLEAHRCAELVAGLLAESGRKAIRGVDSAGMYLAAQLRSSRSNNRRSKSILSSSSSSS